MTETSPLIAYLRAAHNAAQARSEQLANDLAIYVAANDGKTGQQSSAPNPRAQSTLAELREAERHVGRGEVLLGYRGGFVE